MSKRWRHVLAAVAVVVGGTLILRDVLSHQTPQVRAGTTVDYGSSPGNSASSAPVPTMDPAQSDACRLLATQDIAQAVGGSAVIGSGIPGIDAHISNTQCTWAVTGSSVLGQEGTVHVQSYRGPDLGTSTFEKKEVATGQAKAVQGLGKSAYFNPKLNTLSVLYSNGNFTLQLLGFAVTRTSGGTLPEAEKMAQAMLKRI
jgi:hypothetical protein